MGTGVSVDSLAVRCYPSTDEDFAADVREELARCSERVADGRVLLDTVSDGLRSRYPEVVIRERDRLADVGQHEDTWYIYRHGRVA